MCVRDLRGHCLRGYLQSVLFAAALLAVGCSGDDTSDRDDDLDDGKNDDGKNSASADDDDDDDDDDDSDGDKRADAGKSTVKDAGKDAGKADSGKSTLDASMEGKPVGDGSMPSARPDAGGTSGGSDSGRSTDSGSTEPKMDLGKGNGKDVIAIGDSWMNTFFYGIQQSLVTVSGQPYRTYAVPGTRMLDGVIPGQYEAAKRENPDIKTVVMTGGGNDILQDNLTDACARLEQSCKDQLEKISQRTFELYEEMAADGVKDVISIGYSRGDGQYEASIEYTIETYWKPEFCPEGLRCHQIDSDEIIHGVLADTIHPTEEGADAIAAAVYKLMQDEGMRR